MNNSGLDCFYFILSDILGEGVGGSGTCNIRQYQELPKLLPGILKYSMQTHKLFLHPCTASRAHQLQYTPDQPPDTLINDYSITQHTKQINGLK